MTEFQYQTLFTCQDIKQFEFLNPSLDTRRRHQPSDLSSVGFSKKFSHVRQGKKDGTREVQQFECLENKKSSFGKTKSSYGNFLSALFG